MNTFLARLTTAAAALGVAAAAVAGPTASASTDDERFLAIVANLEVQLAPQQAIQSGHELCSGVTAGVAQGVDPADIRASLVTGLAQKGLSDSQAANFFWAAVDVYCPQYNDVAGD